MSSTSNVQNLLTNVFRPRYTYNTETNNYQTRLELTNIDNVSANTVTAYAANIGDSNSNVYVGIGSGNSYTLRDTRGSSRNTFVGTSAGSDASNVINSVFLGYRAGANIINGSSNSISIGANSSNGGNSNIYIGCGTGMLTGSNNIFIGPGVTGSGLTTPSNTLLIGSGSSTTLNGDLVNKRVGINLTNLPTFDPIAPIMLDVSGYARIGTVQNGKLGVNISPAYSLDVNGNMRVSDGYGVLSFSNINGNSVTSISNLIAGSNATMQVTGGFYSKTGTIALPPVGGEPVVIGSPKRGLIVINAGRLSDGEYSSSLLALCTNPELGTFAVVTYNSFSIGVGIDIGSSGIILINNVNSSIVYSYSITYLSLY